MKAIAATLALFLTAGVCIAGPQPTQRRVTSNITDILNYNNIGNQKPKFYPGPKVYALTMENAQMGAPAASQSTENPNNKQSSGSTFTPNPLVNYYKEFR